MLLYFKKIYKNINLILLSDLEYKLVPLGLIIIIMNHS